MELCAHVATAADQKTRLKAEETARREAQLVAKQAQWLESFPAKRDLAGAILTELFEFARSGARQQIVASGLLELCLWPRLEAEGPDAFSDGKWTHVIAVTLHGEPGLIISRRVGVTRFVESRCFDVETMAAAASPGFLARLRRDLGSKDHFWDLVRVALGQEAKRL